MPNTSFRPTSTVVIAGALEVQRKAAACAPGSTSAEIDSAVTFGVRRPTILVPGRLLDAPEPHQRAIVAHELQHVARRDWVWVLAEEGLRLERQGRWRESTVALEAAADLYRGDLLEGLDFRGALFEDWLMAERERLRELALDALARLLAYQRSAGLAEPALQTALRLIALDPLQEAVHRTLMRLYAQLGRRGAALRQYQG